MRIRSLSAGDQITCDAHKSLYRRRGVSRAPCDSGLQYRRRATQIHVADTGPRQVAQRSGDKRDAHPGGDEADDRLHLDRFLDDSCLPTMRGVITGYEVMEGR